MPFQLPDFEVRCTNASESELKEHIESQAKLSRSCLLEEFEFLFSRPDIINDIQWLSVFGEDFSHACDMLGYEAGSEEYDLFFAPLLTRASELLKRTVNVKTLLMKRLLISEDIAYAVLALSQLRVLKITHCEFLEETHLPLCASVLNVYLYMDQPQHVDSWKLIPSFPNLRFLTICGDSNLVDSLPGPDLFTACNPFRSLERLMLRGISPDDISTLVAWLHTSPDLRLTHFKIEAGEFGIVPIETLRLVGALARCPLQVLALIGIRYAEPPLVDIISEKFPGLVALTLVFRDSPRQTRDKSTIWPCPTWEYAVLLGGFQHLEYFGWNMEVPQMPTDFSRTLKYLEEGFPDDDSWIFDVDSTWRDGDSQEDWYSVVRVLAAYSPSLQWVSFTNDPVGKYKVSRQPNGWINVKNEMSWEAFKTADKYSPHASGREWEFSNEST